MEEVVWWQGVGVGEGGQRGEMRRFKVKCVTVTNGIYLINILTSWAPPPRLHVAGDGALALINVSRVIPPSNRSLMSLVWPLYKIRVATRTKKSFKCRIAAVHLLLTA